MTCRIVRLSSTISVLVRREMPEGLQDGEDVGGGERLDQIFVGADLARDLQPARIGLARHQDDEGLVALEAGAADRFHAAHLGHVDVDEGEVDATLLEQHHAFDAGSAVTSSIGSGALSTTSLKNRWTVRESSATSI